MEVEIEAEVESGSLTHSPNRFYHRGHYQATGAAVSIPLILSEPSGGRYNSFPMTIQASTNTEGKQ